MNRISFHDTHVYPGCTAIIFFKIIPNSTVMPVTAEFSDGSIAVAEVEQLGPEEILIHIDTYITERGTRISEKSWRLRYQNEPDLWKVAARMPGHKS
ncbi:MAG: hypothetical protein QM594_19295 [Niabella sp.]